jgi:xanthine dehydrogenase accessory factor
MENIHQILNHISHTNKDVLATIIRVEGSAYRKEGTTMLIQECGNRIGVLSAGCLEEDIQAQAEKLKFGTSKVMTYDMKSEDDFSWGQGAGCNGIITVLLESIDNELQSHLSTLKEYLRQGKSVMLVKKLATDFTVSNYLFYVDDDQFFGDWQGVVSSEKIEQLKTEKSGIVYIEEWSAYCFCHYFKPRPRLNIFGAGVDSVPLAEFASKSGFYVTVCDWRPAFCSPSFFPSVDKLIVGFPYEMVSQVDFQKDDFSVIMTHHFQHDRDLLNCLIDMNLLYIGVMGSIERTSRLLDGRELPRNVYTPIGMSIHAEGPEEIAISILAEIIQIKRLREKNKIYVQKRIS